MLELAEAQPLEEPTEAPHNGVEEMTVSEPDAEEDGQPVSPAAEPSADQPPIADAPPTTMEEPAQNDQSDAQLSSPDVRRLKKMRVRRKDFVL